MKGYRTVITNILMAVASIAGIYGIDIPPDDLAAVSTGIITVIGVVNLILRKITTGPMGTKE